MGIDEQKTLVMDLKSGNEKAFEKLIFTFTDKIKTMAFKILNDNEAAQDVAQNVFLNIFRKIGFFRGGSKLSTWVYRITINEIFQYCRKSPFNIYLKETNKKNSLAAKTSWPEPALLYIELNALLRKSIQKLSQKEAMVFIYHDIDKIPTREISKVLNSTVPAIKSNLLRGRRKLRRSLIGRYLASQQGIVATQND